MRTSVGFVQRAPRPVLSKRDNFGRVHRHANVDQKRDGRKSCNRADQQQSSANNLHHADEGSHDLWSGDANFDESSDSQSVAEQEFLNPFLSEGIQKFKWSNVPLDRERSLAAAKRSSRAFSR